MCTSLRRSSKPETLPAQRRDKDRRRAAYHVRDFIEHGLSSVEQIESLVELRKRIRRGEAEIFSLEEVRAELGLDG